MSIIESISEIRNIKSKTDFLTQKQKIIAENIANSNTPEYRRKIISDKNSFNQNINMAITNQKHINIKNSNNKFYISNSNDMTYMKKNGNNVVLETEIMEQSKVATEYKSIIKIYKEMSNMIKKAGKIE